ncbi:uncharacterized protein [Eurosta solidaginis]|uniref:uncharacterized protein isoform X2 n=1 Tax=Eurosta solidaginis TaxID=178769 RepID=UPI0035311A02
MTTLFWQEKNYFAFISSRKVTVTAGRLNILLFQLNILILKHLNMENIRPSQQKRQKRAFNFSSEEKLSLIEEVKARPRIWNIGDPLHSNKNAVEQSWEQIGIVLSKPECKAAWISLRESYRYREKVARKAKSGSDGGEPLSEPSISESVDWEFAAEMSFLPNVSQKRKTFTSTTDAEAGTPDAPSPQYDYAPTPYSRPAGQSQSEEVWKKFDSLLQQQQDLIKGREQSESESHFKQAFTGFEYLLKQLPRPVADEACCDFMNTLLEKIAQQRHRSSQN